MHANIQRQSKCTFPWWKLWSVYAGRHWLVVKLCCSLMETVRAFMQANCEQWSKLCPLTETLREWRGLLYGSKHWLVVGLYCSLVKILKGVMQIHVDHWSSYVVRWWKLQGCLCRYTINSWWSNCNVPWWKLWGCLGRQTLINVQTVLFLGGNSEGVYTGEHWSVVCLYFVCCSLVETMRVFMQANADQWSVCILCVVPCWKLWWCLCRQTLTDLQIWLFLCRNSESV